MNEIENPSLYQIFIFLGPTCITSILLIVLYLVLYFIYPGSDKIIDFCIWSFLRMRRRGRNNNLSKAGLGLNKYSMVRIPIVIFKESLSVKYSRCSMCHRDYEEDEILRRMPECGHVFHMDCIDPWFRSHTTCPFCRVSLLFKPPLDWSHQFPGKIKIVSSSMENPNEARALAQPEFTAEAMSHFRILSFFLFTVFSLVIGIAFHLVISNLFYQS